VGTNAYDDNNKSVKSVSQQGIPNSIRFSPPKGSKTQIVENFKRKLFQRGPRGVLNLIRSF
jgi:hypothetical protein